MRINLPFSRRSLKAKLISRYLVVLAIGGLVTSMVGSYIVSSSIMMQARQSVDHHMATAQTIYNQQLETLKLAVQLAASGTIIPQYLTNGRPKVMHSYLEGIRKSRNFDFLTLTDRAGRAVLRVSQSGGKGDDVSSLSVVRAALSGQVAAATEILPAGLLGNEDPLLRERASIRIVSTPHARPPGKSVETSGMVLIAASPVHGPGGELLGALYGGVLLNRNFAIVDRVWELVFKGERYEDQDVGSVTIFENDLRISTNVKTASGERAVGTLISAEVNDAVLGRGGTWQGRAFVVRDWYLSRYEPIRNFQGKTVGVLYVGRLEKAYKIGRAHV